MNSGGRKEFDYSSEVCLLALNGMVMKKKYLIGPAEHDGDTVRADRKGRLIVREAHSGKEIRVHYRRVLPPNVHGKCVVTSANNKYHTICPKCENVFKIETTDGEIDCPNCGIMQLYWTNKPEFIKKEKQPMTKDTTNNEQQTNCITLDEIKILANCELWSKSITFDHPTIEAKAHVLIFLGDNPRKLNFNSYDGGFGKRVDFPALLESFINGDGEDKKRWYPVKDIEKEREKLSNKGYTK